MGYALWLTRGKQKTFPVLRLDGRNVGRLDRGDRRARAALSGATPLPRRPEQRRRALALEDFFDEELGPYARHLAFYELINEPAMFAEVAAQSVPAPLARAKGLVGAYGRAFTRRALRRQQRRRPPKRRGRRSSPRWIGSTRARGERAADIWSGQLQRRRPDRRFALLPGGGSRRGTGIAGLADAPRARALPRRPQRPRRLRLGRRDVHRHRHSSPAGAASASL